jgi:CBS domain-containing protein
VATPPPVAPRAPPPAAGPIAYLRATPPFHALPEPLFAAAARALEVGFWPAGSRLASAGGSPLAHLYVVRRGAVRLERGGHLLQVLEEGETFGYTSLITRQATLDVLVEDDLLAYRLPDAEFQRLLGDAGFAAHFAAGLSQRLRASLEHSPVATLRSDVTVELGALVRRPAVWIGADATVGAAARVMRDERISSVLVRGEPPGIVTDHDLRSRVLADRLGPDLPVARVKTTPLRTFAAATPLHEAWTALLDAGVNHLPIAGEGGAIQGVITSTDLLKASAQGPVAVLRRIERLAAPSGLPGYAEKVAEMASALLAGGLAVPAIAGLVRRLNDALLARVLAWAEADLGPAPAPYAWLALGSDGRGEQVLLTDQDNALVFADEAAPARAWYEALARRVNEDLARAGFPRCPYGHEASAELGTRAEWTRRLAEAVEGPRPQAAAFLLDLRRAAGALDLAPLEAERARGGRSATFLRFLARAALDLEVAEVGGLRLRGEAEVDLKAGAIQPVVFLARCYGLEVGSPERSTLGRLEAARQVGLMGEEAHAGVTEAYRFLLGLRLRRQLRDLAERRPPSSVVAWSELSAIERSRLKESLRAIRRWREKAGYHYRTDFF